MKEPLFESNALKNLSDALEHVTLVPHTAVTIKTLYPALRELLDGVRQGDVPSDLRAWDKFLDRLEQVL